MDNRELAIAIIEAVGGSKNINSFTHCATRLRIMVNDKEQIDTKTVENLPKVKGTMFNAGQYQIILGTGLVNKVYDEMSTLEGNKKQDNKLAKKEGNLFQRAIRIFGDVFVPIIPVLVATGLFMGVRGLITQEAILGLFGMTTESIPANLLTFTQVLTDTAFAFLPALVCWSTFKVFGGSPVLGIVLGLMLVNPVLPNAWEVGAKSAEPLVFFGFIKVAGYQGSVLPAFFSGIVGSKLEQFLKKRIPDSVDLMLTPFLTLIGAITAALFVIGPVFHGVEELVLKSVDIILGLPFGIGGFIYGALLPILVIFGVHHILSFLEITLLAQTGMNPMNPLGNVNMAMAGAVLAVAIRTKSNRMKQIAYPSAFSAALGISEPAIFGVSLPLIFPFGMSMLGAGVASFIANILDLKATGMGLTAIPGILLFLNEQLPFYLLIKVVAFAVAFILTFVLYKEKEENAQKVIEHFDDTEKIEETNEQGTLLRKQTVRLVQPIDGKMIPIDQVADPVFSGKMMGDGFAIEPTGTTLYAPISGTIEMVAPTKHAIGIKSDDGLEVLLHLGIDTVSLNGEPFEIFVTQGQKIEQDEKLATIDINRIQKSGKDPVVIAVITNRETQKDKIILHENEVEVQLA